MADFYFQVKEVRSLPVMKASREINLVNWFNHYETILGERNDKVMMA